jgi:hypothetical protein
MTTTKLDCVARRQRRDLVRDTLFALSVSTAVVSSMVSLGQALAR